MTNHAFALDGVYPAAVTPFNEHQELDAEGIERVIEHCIAGGVSGLVIAGTTGEYYALREQERMELFAAASRHARGRISLIAGCNAGSTREAIDLGMGAKQLGYDAILLPVPHTSLPNQRELAAHFETVAQEVGLPVVLYNFPARAGVEIALETLERLRDVPEIIAIKEASGDFSRFLTMRHLLGDDVAVSCGSDDQAYDYFSWGVQSWIAGTANVLPREHVELLEAVRRGDLATARAIHAAMLPWIQDMESGSYNQKAKLGLRLVGVEVGEVRAPLRPLPQSEADHYERLLAAAIDAASTIAATAASTEV
jgi:4-hydroxy-tetrahydrodipicolinate synthase